LRKQEENNFRHITGLLKGSTGRCLQNKIQNIISTQGQQYGGDGNGIVSGNKVKINT
jgi:hypothetical protein